jgi:glyoxylase I family protein
MPDFPPLAHVAVTVTDLERSTAWYTALFGSGPVLDEDEEGGAFHHTVYVLSGGQLFGLHTHTEPAAGSFDERSIGLDHVSFATSGRGELQQWADRLDALGVTHGGIKDASGWREP